MTLLAPFDMSHVPYSVPFTPLPSASGFSIIVSTFLFLNPYHRHHAACTYLRCVPSRPHVRATCKL